MGNDFRDILAEPVAADARFMVVGAYALGVHGVPRATVDLDIWIDATPENTERVWAALSAFGAPLSTLAVTRADFTRPDVVIQFGVPPFRIDFLTSVSGVAFDEAWPDRIVANFDDIAVPYIGRVAFVRTKRASGRLKYMADLEALGEL